MPLVQQWPKRWQETSDYNEWDVEDYLLSKIFRMVLVSSSKTTWIRRYSWLKKEDDIFVFWKWLLYNNGRNVGRKCRIITNEIWMTISSSRSCEWCWFRCLRPSGCWEMTAQKLEDDGLCLENLEKLIKMGSASMELATFGNIQKQYYYLLPAEPQGCRIAAWQKSWWRIDGLTNNGCNEFGWCYEYGTG